MTTSRLQLSQVQYKFALALVIVSVVPAAAVAQSAVVRAELPDTKVGDRWKFETRDRRTGLKKSESAVLVTSVSGTHIEGVANGGKFVSTRELNAIETPTLVFSGDMKFYAFPLEIGKKWALRYSVVDKIKGYTTRWQLDATVVAYEQVKVPAGEFAAFRIDYRGFWKNDTTGRDGRGIITSWYAPAARNVVRREIDDAINVTVLELVEVRLQP